MNSANRELTSNRVTVMGLGRFGGGVGVTRWLISQDAHVLVTDLESSEKLREPVDEIQREIDRGDVTMRLGEHRIEDFTNCDLVIANPAVPRPWTNQFINAAIGAGVPVTTEIGLLTQRINRERVIGVTGSAGKSTTAAMIHHILTAAGFRSHLGGNIGGSLLNQLDQIRSDDWIVLELSSAMLHWLGMGVASKVAPGWSPHVAVLTNISPNHIDWHGTFAHYEQSKLNIFRYQRPGDHEISSNANDTKATPPHVALNIPGQHNQSNARLAFAAAKCATGLDARGLAPLLSTFRGLPHRLQLVAERDGMKFYNDSKSTTPEATVLAVAAFENPARVHLIAGGYDKGSDLGAIAQLTPRIAGLYTIGKTGAALAEPGAALGGFARYCETLQCAVDAAFDRMKPHDVLLLSPGCASWDQFTNYEERGDTFVKLVNGQLNVAV